MKIKSKFPILMILVFGLLATIAYAKSFTDVLGESLGLINDFFRNEGYKPYALAIDFFVFFAVFLAIYMRGIKFAFKEVNKTEKGLAIVLALTTAFLLVLGGYSIEKLLPFLQYFLFFLLFALIWWLLKDMKSKWLRFLLALLLALLLLLIFFGLFSATSYRIGCPESALPWLPWLLALLLFILFWFLLKDIKNALGRFLLALLLTIAVVLLILFLLNTFSKNLGCPEGPFATSLFADMSDSFKRMDIGTFEGISFGGSLLPELSKTDAPDKKKEEEKAAEKLPAEGKEAPDLPKKETEKPAPKVAPPPRELPADRPAPPPGQESPDIKEEKPSSGSPMGWIAALVAAALAVGGGLWWRRSGGFGRKGGRAPVHDPFNEGGYLGSPVDMAAKRIKKIDDILGLIQKTQNEKDKLVLLGENHNAILEGLKKASAANLWTDKGRETIRKEIPILHELLGHEEQLRSYLAELRTAESLFLKELESWQRIIPQEYYDYFKKLASRESPDFKQMGIIQLAVVLDAFEKQDEASIKEVDALLKERKIAELVQGKFKIVKTDWDKLKKYNTHENTILSTIIAKAKKQKDVLSQLETRLSPEMMRARQERKDAQKARKIESKQDSKEKASKK